MTVLVGILVALIALGSAYALFSLICVLAFFTDPLPPSGRAPKDAELPGVSVLKPVKGLEPSCAENLSSFCAQDYPCYEVLFGFREKDDPALPLAGAIAAAAQCEARVVVGNKGSGTNQKVLNLEALESEAAYPLLALSDSDMVVDRWYLRRIVAEFQGGDNTGIVTSLYKISNPASLGGALESLTLALDFLPSVLVARRLEGVTFGLGASILVSKKALGEIGGFGAFADFLADDYQLGFRLWKRGFKNILSLHVIENRVGPMSIASYMTHQLRWARTYRASRPMGFLGYGITHAFFFALLLALVRPAPATVAMAMLVLALRYALSLVAYRKVINEKGWLRWLFLLPLKDVLAFLIWLWSFIGSTISWRGTQYRIQAGGRIVRL